MERYTKRQLFLELRDRMLLALAIGGVPVKTMGETNDLEDVYMLAGYNDPKLPSWFSHNQVILRSAGFNLIKIMTPDMNLVPADESLRRRSYFGSIDAALFADERPKRLYGVSAGGGGVQMYLDYLAKNNRTVRNQNGELLLREVGILHARDLSSPQLAAYLENPAAYSPNDRTLLQEFREIPPEVRGFYSQIGNEARDFAIQNGITVKIGYGTDDEQVPVHNGQDLARYFGVNGYEYAVGHMGIVEQPAHLQQIMSS